MSAAHPTHLAALVAWFEALTPDNVARTAEFYAPDALFHDPFNDVRGTSQVQRIYAHLFEQVGEPRFEVHDSFSQGDRAVLLWTFRFRSGAQACEVEGASRLLFNAAGLITSHRDYWDPVPAVYGRLPVLGRLLGWARRRLAAPQH